MNAIDQFAGAGGWDVGAAELGINPLGIELDEWACKTREAAGMRTLQADVSALNPVDFAPCELQIASPPCTAFSMAGKGKGRDALFAYATAIEHLRHGAEIDREWLDRECDDKTAHLVLEPLRWALVLEPELIACEQVPPVLPLWERMADVLRERGYSVWTGVLEAERYGVPQTRDRAILMASRVGTAHPPQPTHQRYVPGEPARHEGTLYGELLPWVSMAEALGWNGPARQRYQRGAGMTERHGERPDRALDEPSFTIQAGNQGSGTRLKWELDVRQNGATPRSEESPAPTMLGEGLAKGVPVWRYRNGNQPNAAQRPADTPAPTVHFGHNLNEVTWVQERPATTVQGDPRISPPGWRGNPEDYKRPEGPTRSGDNAIRVSVEEAAILQTFPANFPWQGPKTAQFRQIGNAVPPLLAQAILSALTGVAAETERAA